MRKNLFLWLVLLFFLIAPFFNKLILLATDYLWFQELALSSVFSKTLLTQIGCGVTVFALTLAILIINILVAEKLSSGGVFIPRTSAAYELFMRLSTFRKRIFMLACFAIAVLAGIWGSGLWEMYLKFINAVPFGSTDPLFGKDIGFYVFKLPFYKAAYYGLLTILIISFLGSLLIYIIRGGIYIASMPPTIPRRPRFHLFFLAGIIVGLLYFHFDFTMYSMVNQGNEILSGAGYADIHFEIPVLKIMKIVAIGAGVLIWVSIAFGSIYLPAGAIAAIVALAFTGAAGGQLLQKLIVAPNELSRETPYIKWSIAGTRAAFNLDKIEEKSFVPSEDLTKEKLQENSATIENIRLWDHGPLKTTYSQLQEIRTYYEFLDVDNDRYMINGELRQVMLSPRELVPASLPSRIWINERLSYTHGYGLCLGPVNQVTKEGLPNFFIKNIPPVSSDSIQVTRPEIYYGEAPAGYVVVNTKAKEFDYPSGDQNVYSTYQGSGGIKIGGLLQRLLFVARFREIKLLLSTDIERDSRIMLYREILERASHAAPFLKFDSDPYMVITREGKLFWIIDAYTTTSAYPYSYNAGVGNYIRNSVKVMIDAYNGTMNYYTSDETDPIVQTYSRIFPEMFKPLKQMPSELRDHIRYPQTMFALQARVYSEYHMTDPQVFYNKEDLWKVPNVNSADEGDKPMPPYYTVMKLAEVGQKEEFILMVPFTPAKKDNMIAWLAARCDGPDYGKLIVFNFPKQKLVYGPRQIDSRISQDAEISKQLTLWNQGGSRVIRGSLLVIPVSQSLLMVQPLYIEAKGGGLPELKRVIVAYGNSIAMEENLELSLERIFGKAERVESGAEDQSTDTSTGISSSIKEMISNAQSEFKKGQDALANGDWSGYGRSMNRVRDLINEIAKQSK